MRFLKFLFGNRNYLKLFFEKYGVAIFPFCILPWFDRHLCSHIFLRLKCKYFSNLEVMAKKDSSYYCQLFLCGYQDKKIEWLNKYFVSHKILRIQKTDIKNFRDIAFEPNHDFQYFDDLVSVIMTVYNTENYVHLAIKSILNQTHKNIELIIVNDGSSDCSKQVVLNTISQYKNVIFLDSEKNIGTYNARNLALKSCSGNHITFQDSDDISHPQRIYKQLEELKASGNSVSIAKQIRIDENLNVQNFKISPCEINCLSTLFIERDVFEKIGFFRGRSYGADSEYFDRIKTLTDFRISYIHIVLNICLSREDSLTNKWSNRYGKDKVRKTFMARYKGLHNEMLKKNKSAYRKFVK